MENKNKITIDNFIFSEMFVAIKRYCYWTEKTKAFEMSKGKELLNCSFSVSWTVFCKQLVSSFLNI